jgi:hypothetical protein
VKDELQRQMMTASKLLGMGGVTSGIGTVSLCLWHYITAVTMNLPSVYRIFGTLSVKLLLLNRNMGFKKR